MDVVVTVPKTFRYNGKRGLAAWISEGDPAGEEWSGEYWDFETGGYLPRIEPGERVYVVCEDRLRGFAPLVDVRWWPYSTPSGFRRPVGRVCFTRAGGAVAVTISGRIRGFQGWRYRWWERSEEVPFPDWME